MRIKLTLAVITGLAGLAVLGAATTAAAAPERGPTHQPSPSESRQVQQIRDANAKFHNISAAERSGYVAFTDTSGISCIEDSAMSGMAGMGGMGVHYVKPAVIANPAIHLTEPEALVYAPDRDGTLRLAAVEYLVDKAAWDATHRSVPELFRGHPFSVTPAPNRYGLNTFYSQHVWAWKSNPAGLLAMWNPTVHCEWA